MRRYRPAKLASHSYRLLDLSGDVAWADSRTRRAYGSTALSDGLIDEARRLSPSRAANNPVEKAGHRPRTSIDEPPSGTGVAAAGPAPCAARRPPWRSGRRGDGLGPRRPRSAPFLVVGPTGWGDAPLPAEPPPFKHAARVRHAGPSRRCALATMSADSP